jgi:hypothetical protein
LDITTQFALASKPAIMATEQKKSQAPAWWKTVRPFLIGGSVGSMCCFRIFENFQTHKLHPLDLTLRSSI